MTPLGTTGLRKMGVLGSINPDLSRVQGLLLRMSFRSNKRAEVRYYANAAASGEKFKKVATLSAYASELKVMCVCNSVMTRHQAHGCMDAALDAYWLAYGPTASTYCCPFTPFSSG